MFCINNSKKKIKLHIFFLYIFISNVSISYSFDNSNIIDKLENQCKSAAVIDATNGEIIYSYNFDKKIFPASLTKIMTAYVVFDAIDKGIIGINDEVDLPSKLAPEGIYEKKLTINNLLYKMVVKSSNIASDILAKEIYGSTDKFVSKMNYFAKKIGMKNTNFTNTNGLYDINNYSTAHDIAKLSIRLVYDFPQYIDFFGITNYIDENGNYNTKTSKIQDYMIGLEGSKTGYLNASGYNLSAWGRYGKKHLFIILIGANTKNNRDKFVIELINLSTNNDNNITEGIKTDKFNFFKKILDFTGIEYNSYFAPKPIERTLK